jgi:hypothetical protein
VMRNSTSTVCSLRCCLFLRMTGIAVSCEKRKKKSRWSRIHLSTVKSGSLRQSSCPDSAPEKQSVPAGEEIDTQTSDPRKRALSRENPKSCGGSLILLFLFFYHETLESINSLETHRQLLTGRG